MSPLCTCCQRFFLSPYRQEAKSASLMSLTSSSTLTSSVSRHNTESKRRFLSEKRSLTLCSFVMLNEAKRTPGVRAHALTHTRKHTRTHAYTNARTHTLTLTQTRSHSYICTHLHAHCCVCAHIHTQKISIAKNAFERLFSLTNKGPITFLIVLG